jgi:tRNA A-37 threonylcarbamoyl transferase component Bud32
VIPELRRLEGKYEIVRKLREGGMGAIYLVRHRLLDELRVVKLMRPQLQDESEFRERFAREARVAIRLRHPNIAQLYDFAVDEHGVGYMVLEYVDGRTLQELVEAGKLASMRLKIELACQALAALGFLHRRGFVHRDVSPDNLMLTWTPDGEPLVKLIDLGIVKVLHGEGGKTGTHVFLGKVRYASPEQFEGSQIDARSDLYSFGVLLYELLTGVHPFSGGMHSMISGHMFRAPRPFDEADPEGRVPAELRRIVSDALTKNPGERIATAEEFARRLRALRLPEEPEGWSIETLRLEAPKPGTGAGATSAASVQQLLDERFDARESTPKPTEAAPGRADSGERWLADAEAMLQAGRPDAAAILLQHKRGTAATDAATAERRVRLEGKVGDELVGRQLSEWKALLDEKDAPFAATRGLARRLGGRTGWILLAVLVVAAGVAALVWSGRVESPAPAAPRPATSSAAESAPGPGASGPAAPVATGFLVLDAQPWGRVDSVVSLPDGASLAVPGDGLTPLRLELPPGRYRATLSHPDFGSRTVEVELGPGGVETGSVRFGDDLAETFVQGF